MLIDEADILIKAGDGGNGSASFKRNAQTSRGGPDGGNGGNGGNVYIKGVDDITLLIAFRYTKEVRAEDGVNGAKQNLYGRNGKDTILNLPLGTYIKDLKTNEVFEVNSKEPFLIARGGKGGRGNNEFKSATNQAPKFAEKGEKGEERRVQLVLKLIADVGLIGLPNSGKSTLLSILTNAHPKIGNYPFTTLEPNLGVMDGLILADIPGLIEGASSGKGLGIKFLRHVEKTKILIHCIDIENEDIKKTYETIRKELAEYDESLTQKREILLLTKSDLVDKKIVEKKLKIAKKLNNDSYAISVYDDLVINEFKEKLVEFTNI
jgi:GTP-binding protein